MAAPEPLLSDLEHAIRRGSAERRAATVEQITALFLSGADRLSEEQVAVFDEVFCRLVTEIEARALVELAATLAPIGNAPVQLIRKLAGADDIGVAGPVLTQSARLAEADLVEIARQQGQDHLLALAARPEIAAPVTDVLVARGDQAVVHHLAGNASAQFSEGGFTALVQRAGTDSVLAEQVGRRSDIPTKLFRRLVLQATTVVQARLVANATPALQTDIKRILAGVASDLDEAQRRDYRAARGRVAALRRRGQLNEAKLVEFAKAGAFDDTTVALAALSRVPLHIIDRLINAGRPDPILILCKAMGYPWPTVEAVLSLRLMAGSPSLASAMDQFDRLSDSTAGRVMHFWRARLSQVAATPERALPEPAPVGA